MKGGVDGNINDCWALEGILENPRITAWHISLYAAMIYCRGKQDPGNAFYVTRRRLMKLAHIRGIATYHKCMKELVRLGFVL